ncbi:uncharacterized protein LOC134896844 [Pseudophryne corroboree]|uniref:uncharacterized protein LOC134896844 n=1 Tax=Pseudophryne corroboree TaxID=495146 RepID=UPI0030815D64
MPVRVSSHANPRHTTNLLPNDDGYIAEYVEQEQYIPWFPSDIMRIVNELPNIRKSPAEFEKKIKQVYLVYRPCWVDLEQILRASIGIGEYNMLLAIAAQEADGDRGKIENAPLEANRYTMASGSQLLYRVQVRCQQIRDTAPAEPDLIQKNLSIREYYDRLSVKQENEGFPIAEPNNARLFKTRFLNGLRPEYRQQLYAVRPEANLMNITSLVEVLEGIQDNERGKQDKKTSKTPAVTIHVVQAAQSNTKTHKVQNQGRGVNNSRPYTTRDVQGEDMTGKCFWCKITGHQKKDCRKYRAWLKSKDGVPAFTVERE